MTLLEAVNLSLRSIGQTGVTSLTSNHPKFQTILDTIDAKSMEVQRRNWWFNTGRRTLEPLTSGPNTGKIDTSAYDFAKPIYAYLNYYPQGGFLVDGRDGQPVMNQAVEVEARWLYPTTDNGWLQMPAAFTDFVAADAALTFAANYDADQLQLAKLQQQKLESGAVVKADHIRYAKVNLFNSGSAGLAIQRAWGGRYNRLYR